MSAAMQKYSKAKQASEGRFFTPWFRAAFVSVFTPAKPMNQGDKSRYECTMLFDPEAVDLSVIKAAIYNCAKAKFGDKIKPSKTFDLPKGFKSPLRDGDEKADYDGYEGMIFAAARSNFAPQVIDADCVEIGSMDQPGFYSGCYARATIGMYAYDVNGNRGVSLNLNNLQKLADGKAFGGARVNAEDEFEAASDFEGPETLTEEESFLD